MTYELTTNQFQFIAIDFYETLADPREFFNHEYSNMPEYMEEIEFDFDKYKSEFVPDIQSWADEVSERLKDFGLISIKVKDIESPREYNFYSDLANLEVEVKEDWKSIAVKTIREILQEDKIVEKYRRANFVTRSGFIFYGPESWGELLHDLKTNMSDFRERIVLSMYLTLCFIYKHKNLLEYEMSPAEDAWDHIVTGKELNYDDYATTKLLVDECMIPYIENDSMEAKRDEIYWKTYDKYGWRWRNMLRVNERNEFTKMCIWAKENKINLLED